MARQRPAPGAQAPKTKPFKRSAAYLALRKETESKFGQGVIQNAGDAYRKMRYIPFGHLIGDLSLLGGLPEGRAAMFIGKERGGKTTQAMRCVAQFQKKYPDKLAIWADPEQTFDPLWATQHGVDLDRLDLVQSTVGEDIVDFLKAAKADVEELGMMVLDSINATVPMKEYNDSVADTQVALHPRLMGRMCSALLGSGTERIKKGWSPVTEIFINQWRMQIGFVMGDPRTVPGGRQLAHYCASHIEFKSKIKVAKSTQDQDGMEAPMYVEHTFNARALKTPSSLKSGEYHIVVGPDHHLPIGSYDEAGTILTFAKKMGIYQGAGRGQHFTDMEERFGKMEEAKRWLERNPGGAEEIKRRIIAHRRQRVGLPAIPIDGYLLGWG